jgi:hypothetical protein
MSWESYQMAYAAVATNLPLVGVKVCMVELGVNDIADGHSLSQIQANCLTVWNRLKSQGMQVWQTTITPVTTDTIDNWATTNNQVLSAYETNRVALNNWIRTVPPPLSGYVEFSGRLETSINSGYWQPNTTADGEHPNALGYQLLATNFNYGDLVMMQSSPVITGTFSGNGNALTNLNAANMAGTYTGNGNGLTNLSVNAIVGGLTTNLAVLVPSGGTNTLCFTNGILRAIQ